MKKLFFLFLFITVFLGYKEINSQIKNTISEKPMSDTTKTIDTLKISDDSTMVAILETSLGKVEIQLFLKEAPKTVTNFAGLIEKGYYNGIIFHRVIENFMIQGGDPTGTGRGGQSLWGGKFEDEFNKSLKHDVPGILSMANAGPNNNGSQFFITLVPTEWLNGKHTIFGKVLNGMDIVHAIGKVEVTPQANRPLVDVVIKTASVEKRKK